MGTRFAKISLVAAAGVILSSGLCLAQRSGPNEEVTVVAPYLVKKKVLESKPGRMEVFSVTVDRPVSYAGLDLTRDADIAEFEKRIRDAAQDVCARADRMYRQYLPITSHRECITGATRDGLAKMEDVIAASTG